MSGKLDKSLDEILSTRRQARRTNQRRPAAKAAKAAPVGGVRKSTRQAKPTSKAIPAGPAVGSGEGKIIVSGLVSQTSLSCFTHASLASSFENPADVNEANIKVC
ncbi:conserved hypothetical protein [Microsporum canis CBS 113480]|uniref:Uncharacterized protein n=1 Tax=Arthroderma otae (strain ATCC MYA-4605 / CBS 113480) TaxID=554155 RepID=C5FKA1_ARTOC|nr:conserved hypothetical protein [Microsporum canis CBS 113480]EEQ30123.1 conserved hypothetical protein [Microsporum canis CBS 113480]